MWVSEVFCPCCLLCYLLWLIRKSALTHHVLKKTASLCCCLIFQNTKINISHPILAISLFQSIVADTQCIFMNRIMITRKSYLLLWFYHRNIVWYSTEVILNRETLLDLNFKLLNLYLWLALFTHILGTKNKSHIERLMLIKVDVKRFCSACSFCNSEKAIFMPFGYKA